MKKIHLLPIEWFFVILMILGTVLPYSQMFLMYQNGNTNFLEIFTAVFDKPVTGFIGMDLLVTALTFIVFLIWDSKEHKIRYWWLSVIATFAVGVSLGFPLYLLLRSRQLRTE